MASCQIASIRDLLITCDLAPPHRPNGAKHQSPGPATQERSPSSHQLNSQALKGRDNLRPGTPINAMPQSLAQIYAHLVFSTKGRARLIPADLEPRLHSYLAGTLNAIECPVLKVGGMPDHVHLLFRLARTISLSDAVKAAKVESSKWMKDDCDVRDFAWQAGYGAFSVSASGVEEVSEYIRNQPHHHRVRSFQEEFRRLLKRYQLQYDEAYVWD